VLFGDLNFWSFIILGLPVVVVLALGFALAFVIRKGFVKGGGTSSKVIQAELVRIDERLTAIEKMLKDID
jgi:hypothetical protein